MNYNFDTLTTATRNREACKKFFKQSINNKNKQEIWKNQKIQNTNKKVNSIDYLNCENNLKILSRRDSSALPMSIAVSQRQIQNLISKNCLLLLNCSQFFELKQLNFTPNLKKLPVMLHRTPSGAQKKIRQRREEKTQQQNRLSSYSLSNSFSSAASTSFGYQNADLSSNYTNNIDLNFHKQNNNMKNEHKNSSTLDYRSMIDLRGYRSILPEEPYDENFFKLNVWHDEDNLVENTLSKSIGCTDPFDTTVLTSNSNFNYNSHLNNNLNNVDKPLRPPRSAELRQTIPSLLLNKFQHKKSNSSSFDNHQANVQTKENVLMNNIDNKKKDELFLIKNSINNTIKSQKFNGTNNFYFGKPTVQVHPMPTQNIDSNRVNASLSSSNSSISPTETVTKQIPPPVPKKFSQIKSNVTNSAILPPIDSKTNSDNAVDQSNIALLQNNCKTNQISQKTDLNNKLLFNKCNTSSKYNLTNFGNEIAQKFDSKELSNLEIEEPILTSSFTSVEPLLLDNTIDLTQNNLKNTKTSFSLLLSKYSSQLNHEIESYKNINSYCSYDTAMQKNSTLMSTDNFCFDKNNFQKSLLQTNSNLFSIIDLQNRLNNAFINPEEYSKEQLLELEKRRINSIETLSKKASERRFDLETVHKDLNETDELRLAIFQALSTNKENLRLMSRLKLHIIQGACLVELETRLELQLKKLESITLNKQLCLREIEQFRQKRQRRLLEQLDDAQVVRAAYEERDRQLDAELDTAFCYDPNVAREWNYYKTTILKLNVERKQLEDKLENVEQQLQALQSLSINIKNNSTYKIYNNSNKSKKKSNFENLTSSLPSSSNSSSSINSTVSSSSELANVQHLTNNF